MGQQQSGQESQRDHWPFRVKRLSTSDPPMSPAQHTVLEILSDGHWHRRQELLAIAGLSSDDLSLETDRLEAQGLDIERHTSLGLRLKEPLILLQRSRIQSALSPTLLNSLVSFEIHLTIDSTNSRAMRWLADGGRGHALFLAEKQEQGRGRRGRTWISPLARNISLTLVWPVPGLQSVPDGFSLVTALSVVGGLQAAGLRGLDGLRVKWPNDVWLGNAKLAGILLELYGLQAGTGHVIIGIGINVQLSDSARQGIYQPVTDLRSQGNTEIDRNVVVTAILTCLEQNLGILQTSGFEPFREQWLELDALYDQPVELIGGNQRLIGVAKGVGATGALILQTDKGERQISGGEVTPSLRVLG